MASAATINFPGNLAQAQSIADLREIASAPLKEDAEIVVNYGVDVGDGLGGVYYWEPGSLLADNGANVIRPADITPLQAGRWLAIGGGAVESTGGGDGVSINQFPRNAGETSDLPRIRRGQAFTIPLGKWLDFDPVDYVTGEHGQNFNPDFTGTLKSGSRLRGVYGKTRFVKEVGDPTNAYPYGMFGNPEGIGTRADPSVISGNDPEGLKYIEIEGITFVEDVADRGFAEQFAHIHLNATLGLRIRRCRFIGFRGDAIYSGAGDIGGGTQNRINIDTIIEDCYFDGVNQNNRNAISIISGDGGYINNCTFVNCTKPGGVAALDPMDPLTGLGMPGPVDFEPNAFLSGDDPYVMDTVLRNWTWSGLTMTNCGGDAVVCFMPPNSLVPTPCHGFKGSHKAYNCRSGFTVYAESFAVDEFDMAVDFEAHNCRRPALIRACNKLNLKVIATNCDSHMEMGYFNGVSYEAANKVLMESGSSFTNCGAGIGPVVVTWVENSELRYRALDNSACGLGIWRASAVALKNTVLDIDFRPPTTGAPKVQVNAIVRSTAIGTPVIDTATVTDNSTYNGQTNYQFAAQGSPVQFLPTDGTWPVGSKVVGSNPVAGELKQAWSQSATANAPMWGLEYVPGGVADGSFTMASAVMGGMIGDGKGYFYSTAPGVSRAVGSTSYTMAAGLKMRIQLASNTTPAGIQTGFSTSNNTASANTKFGISQQGQLVYAVVDTVLQATPMTAKSHNMQVEIQFDGTAIKLYPVNADGSLGALFGSYGITAASPVYPLVIATGMNQNTRITNIGT